MFWKANPSNWYRLSFSTFHSSLFFFKPISAVHLALAAWRRTRTTRSVGTWACPDCSMAVWGTGARWAVGTPSVCRHVALVVIGTWGMGWTGIKATLPGAGRYPKHGVREKVARRSQPGSIMHLPGGPHSSAFRTYKLAHDCWWCEHVCEGVCGMLRTFYGSRLTATFIKHECS